MDPSTPQDPSNRHPPRQRDASSQRAWHKDHNNAHDKRPRAFVARFREDTQCGTSPSHLPASQLLYHHTETGKTYWRSCVILPASAKRGKKHFGKRVQLTLCPDRTATSHAHNNSGMAMHMPHIMTCFSKRRTTHSTDFPCFDRSKKLPTETQPLWCCATQIHDGSDGASTAAIVRVSMFLAKDEERVCLLQEIMAKHTEGHQRESLHTQVRHGPCLDARLCGSISSWSSGLLSPRGA